MKYWIGEACGNSFHVLLAKSEQENEAFKFFDNLRINQQWTCDSGLLFLADGTAPPEMKVVERDGSISAMCGNGVRVAGVLLDQLGWKRVLKIAGQDLPIERTATDRYACALSVELQNDHALGLGNMYRVAGEPHVVVIVPDVHSFPITTVGKKIAPKANLTVVSKRRGSCIEALTYERGVNGVTQSCGTGACAAARAMHDFVVSRHKFNVKMHDHELRVELNGHAFLEGPAKLGRHT